MSPRRHVPWVGVGLLALVATGPGCRNLSVGAGPLSAHWWEPGHVLRGSVEQDQALAGPRGPMVVCAIPVAGQIRAGRSTSTLLVSDEGVEPSFLVVAAGQELVFDNRGGIFHSFFSSAPENGFDLEQLGPGEAQSLHLQHPGVVQVYCRLHSRKQSTILVVPTTHFTVVGPTGEFTLGGMPAGTYLVEAWREGQPSRRVAWEVPSPGAAPLTIPLHDEPLQGSR